MKLVKLSGIFLILILALGFCLTTETSAALNIPELTEVDIDIMPGSDTNSINLSSAGVIPVAILSSATFDATTVDPDTVSLAGASVKMVGKSDKLLASFEYVNGDGLLDLVCQVLTAEFMIEPGDTTVMLEAVTFSGISIVGVDSIRIVPVSGEEDDDDDEDDY